MKQKITQLLARNNKTDTKLLNSSLRADMKKLHCTQPLISMLRTNT